VSARREPVLAEPRDEDVRFLEDRLYEYNVEATGLADGRGLGVFVRDDGGAIAAAAAGHTWGGTCEIKQVWMRPELRRQGLGRRLLAAAEAEARRRGCRQILLTTFDFQAPRFYQKLGFTVVAELADYPAGHRHLLLRKRLAG
jgi:ribosomal protein S18 acetylase RimI-like enzyme